MISLRLSLRSLRLCGCISFSRTTNPMLLRRLIHDYLLPVKLISDEPMVFPCGISRSGTTLLATVLDAHSRICLGYELLPPPLAGVETVRAKLREGMKLADGDFARAGSHLRKGGDKDIGQWLSR